MVLWDWLKNTFGVGRTVQITQKLESEKYKLQIEMFSIQMAINMIAGLFTKCEFKTYSNGKEIKGDEYYLWNIEPNINQNSVQFGQEFISRLLYNNEVLIVPINGQLIIAESFTQNEYALYPNTFTNVARGDLIFNRTFSMSEVLYYKLNNEDIRALLSQLFTGYSSLLEMSIGKYKRSGGRKGKVRLAKGRSGDQKYQEDLEKMFAKDFKAYFENENALITMPDGTDYEEIPGSGSAKSANEITDIVSITKEAFAHTAQAFRIPPALLQGDIAEVGELIDQLLTFGLDPLVDLVQTENNRKRYGKDAYSKGSYMVIDTSCIKHIDMFDVAEQADKLIASGPVCIDEIRARIGLIPLNTWWSTKHWMTRNYEALAAVETADPPQTEPAKEVKMIVNEFLKSASIDKSLIDENELMLINSISMKELSAEDVFTFKIAACDNNIDRDFEAFSTKSQQKLAELLNGKTVITDHSWTTKSQVARIYKAEVAAGEGISTSGEPYTQLICYCYMLKTDTNKDFIADIEAGIKKEASIGCRVSSVICSVCGVDNMKTRCDHRNGAEIDGQTCYKKLENPVDAYEVSFVAVPSQKDAGVTKSYGGEEPEKSDEQKEKSKTVASLLKAAFAKEQ